MMMAITIIGFAIIVQIFALGVAYGYIKWEDNRKGHN